MQELLEMVPTSPNSDAVRCASLKHIGGSWYFVQRYRQFSLSCADVSRNIIRVASIKHRSSNHKMLVLYAYVALLVQQCPQMNNLSCLQSKYWNTTIPMLESAAMIKSCCIPEHGWLFCFLFITNM